MLDLLLLSKVLKVVGALATAFALRLFKALLLYVVLIFVFLDILFNGANLLLVRSDEVLRGQVSSRFVGSQTLSVGLVSRQVLHSDLGRNRLKSLHFEWWRVICIIW